MAFVTMGRADPSRATYWERVEILVRVEFDYSLIAWSIPNCSAGS